MQPGNIARSELEAALATQRPPVLLEALDEAYYRKAHLPGAIALPLGRLDSVVRERLHDKAAPLVVYCASSTCKNSDVAARALLALGFRDVRVYSGGKADWMDGGLPVETGAESSGTA
ncbi:MAG TPA: rhodanese-like domain-containing protein [Polyangiaceae bacterium]